MLKTVAIYCKEDNLKTADGINRLVKEFCRRNIKMYMHKKSAEIGSCQTGDLIGSFNDLTDLPVVPDIVLSVGGDGTFLETMLKVRDSGIPIAGVNTGRMGFLANISEDEIGHSVDLLCGGDYKIIERSLIEICRPSGLFEKGSSTALNEITVQKADPGMITINVYVDETYLNTYWADGLIVSTATGSTAYNLSVGGPILSPGDESIIISPISPHNLTNRPIILSGESNLRMIVEGRTREYIATCDFRSVRVPFSEELFIKRSADKLKSVMLKGMDFYSTLRNKLMWGADRRN
jgi:NAD+ kinase